jgi:hypothetical protein
MEHSVIQITEAGWSLAAAITFRVSNSKSAAENLKQSSDMYLGSPAKPPITSGEFKLWD